MAVIRTSARRVASRLAALAGIGASGTAVTRLGLTREERRAQELVASWLTPLGARIRRDEAGNLFARFGGSGPCVLMGSHLDSVPEGGRFDGALGVVVAAEALQALAATGSLPRRPIEVVGWADEEGARFGIGLFGSLAAFGRLPADAASRRDRDGVSVAEALRALGLRGDPRRARRDPREVHAYLEPHIEQAQRLADRGIPLAVVSSIVGILHARVTVRGRQDHAGTTPMDARVDALAAAAEVTGALEAAARRRGGVATVGEIAVAPGAKNVVPRECVFSVDVRAPRDATVEALIRDLERALRSAERSRGVRTSVDVLNRVPVARMDARLRGVLHRGCEAAGVDAPELVSYAGHDAESASHAGVPTGMVFVRSRGGSHSPREWASAADAALAARAIAHALTAMGD